MRALRVAVAHHQRHIDALEHEHPLDYSLESLLQQATQAEREALAKLVGAHRTSSRALLGALIEFSGTRNKEETSPGLTRRQRRSYAALVVRVARSVGRVSSNVTVDQETQIIIAAIERIVENLTPATMTHLSEAQATLLPTPRVQRDKRDMRGSAAMFASLARASGMDLYLMAISVTTAISAALDLGSSSLSSASSQALHISLSRLGRAILAPWHVEPHSRNTALAMPVVVLIATLRQRLEHDRQVQLQQHRGSLARDLHALEQQNLLVLGRSPEERAEFTL